MMSAPGRSIQTTLIACTFYLLWVSIVTLADTSMEICVGEETEFHCPPRDVAVEKKQYKSLLWSVFDPMETNSERKFIFYCDQNPVYCATYNLTSLEKRISVRNPVPGRLYVKHLIINDLLTYTCEVQLKGDNSKPLVHRVNITSSVYCLTAFTGQDLNLISQEFAKKQPSKKLLNEDIWWSTIEDNGMKYTFLYCNASLSCTFLKDTCHNSCPEFFKRLEPNGLSLTLRDVRQDDRRLVFQRRIDPNMMETGAKPWPKLYTVKIQNVLPADADASSTSSQTSPSTMVSSTTHTTTSSAGCCRVSALTALASLLMATYFLCGIEAMPE